MEEETKVETPAQEKSKVVHKITLSDAKKFVESLKVVNELLSEATFNLETEGLSVISMDPANVAMVVYKYNAGGFTEYSCPEPKKYYVNLTELNKLLGRIDKEGMTTLEFGDVLTIQSLSKSKKKITLPFLAEAVDKSDKVPLLEFKAVLKASGKELYEAIEDAKTIKEKGGSARFVVANGKFSVVSASDSGRAIVTDINSVATKAENCECNYAIEYLTKMVQGKSLNDEVEIGFSTEYPLRLSFKKEGVELSMIVAPRVSND